MLSKLSKAQELDIVGPVCNIKSFFRNIVINRDAEPKSASVKLVAKINEESIDLFKKYLGRLGTDVFIKIGFASATDNSLPYERVIYKYLLSLLEEMRTPGVIRYISSFECPNFSEWIYKASETDPVFKDIYSLMRKKIPKNFDTNRAYFLVTELGKGSTFSTVAKEHPDFTLRNFLECVFQVMYTLGELSAEKIRHNDLHLKNIWVDRNSSGGKMVFFVDDDTYYVLDGTYTTKLFDFDMSSIAGYDNKKLEDIDDQKGYCSLFGVCKNFNPEFDVHTFATFLYRYLISFPKEMRRKGMEIATMVCQNRWYLGDGCCEYTGRMCDKITITTPSLDVDEDDFESMCDACRAGSEMGMTPVSSCEECAIQARGISAPQKVCNPNFRPKIGQDILTFRDQLNFGEAHPENNIYSGLTKLKLPVFDKRYLPIQRSMDGGIPEEVFSSRVYVSSSCSSSPMDLAKKLLNMSERGEIVDVDFDVVYHSTSVPEAKSERVVVRETFDFTILNIKKAYEKNIEEDVDPKKAYSVMYRSVVDYLIDPDVETFMMLTEKSKRIGPGYDFVRKIVAGMKKVIDAGKTTEDIKKLYSKLSTLV